MEKTNAKVYIIDDEPDYRFLAEQVFKRFLPEYESRFFTGGDVFIQQIFGSTNKLNPLPAVEKPGLILLDVHMPGKSGLQTLAELRRSTAWQHIPVVMMSNASSQQERDACYQLGVNSFLEKPLDMSQLRNTMGAVCSYWLQMNQPASVA